MTPTQLSQGPVVVDEISRGERSFGIYSKLLNGRIAFLTAPMDDTSATSSWPNSRTWRRTMRERHIHL